MLNATGRLLLSFALLLSSITSSFAAGCDFAARLQQIKQTSPGTQERNAEVSKMIEIGKDAACFVNFIAIKRATQDKQIFIQAFKSYEALRTDKQAGSSAGTGGTTNIVSKGLTAQVISFAAEYGALTQSVNNQVVTVKGSLDGFTAALAKQNLIPYCPTGYPGETGCVSSATLRILRRFSYGLSFNTTQNAPAVTGTATGTQQGSAQMVTFNANQKQLSQVTAKVVLWNTRDLNAQAYRKTWESQIQTNKPIAAAADQLSKDLTAFAGVANTQQYKDWFAMTYRDLTTATAEEVDSAWKRDSALLEPILEGDAETLKALTSLDQSIRAYHFAEDDFAESLANQPVITFEFDNNRPTNEESYSTITGIFDKGFGRYNLVANGGFQFYDSTPVTTVPGVGRIRAAQFAAELDRNLGNLAVLGSTGLSAAFYYQDQKSPSILNVTPTNPVPGVTFVGLPSSSTQVFGQKGNIVLGQLKLVLGPGSSSVRIPFAVSYSNRTELITKPTWRAQVGITYDFDSLFAAGNSQK